jgi:hypothetical protein
MVDALPFASEIARQECLDGTAVVQKFMRLAVSGQECRCRPQTRMNARESPHNLPSGPTLASREDAAEDLASSFDRQLYRQKFPLARDRCR